MCCSMRLQRFCCCCTLKTGSLIIAILGWIGTLVKLFGLINIHVHIQESPAPSFDDQDGFQQYSQFKEIDANTYGIRIGYAVVSLIACLLLIWGIHKRSNKFMLPWLIIDCLECILVSIIAIAVFVIIFVVPSNATGIMVAIFIFVSIITYFCWYFWICVWSHYMELSESEVSLDVAYGVNMSPPPYKPHSMA